MIARTVFVVSLFLLIAGALSPSEATDVTFRFRPPEDASMVTVAGTFNDWSTSADPMADPEGDGVWEVTLDLHIGNHQYKYVVNGSDWITDEFAEEFADDGFGGRNSVLYVGEEPVLAGEPSGTAADPKGTPVMFRFRPPVGRANAVSLAGSFNNWNAAADVLTDTDGDGVWEITVYLEPGEYDYQFVVDGERYLADPSGSRHEKDGFGGRKTILTVK